MPTSLAGVGVTESSPARSASRLQGHVAQHHRSASSSRVSTDITRITSARRLSESNRGHAVCASVRRVGALRKGVTTERIVPTTTAGWRIESKRKAEGMQDHSITETIMSIDRGGLDNDAGQKLAELVEELQRAAIAKKADANGSITIKLALKMTPEGAVRVSAHVTKSTPKIPSMPAMRFAGKGGVLLTAPAAQMTLGAIVNRNPMDDRGAS